jgi:hypothetical protein
MPNPNSLIYTLEFDSDLGDPIQCLEDLQEDLESTARPDVSNTHNFLGNNSVTFHDAQNVLVATNLKITCSDKAAADADMSAAVAALGGCVKIKRPACVVPALIQGDLDNTAGLATTMPLDWNVAGTGMVAGNQIGSIRYNSGGQGLGVLQQSSSLDDPRAYTDSPEDLSPVAGILTLDVRGPQFGASGPVTYFEWQVGDTITVKNAGGTEFELSIGQAVKCESTGPVNPGLNAGMQVYFAVRSDGKIYYMGSEASVAAVSTFTLKIGSNVRHDTSLDPTRSPGFVELNDPDAYKTACAREEQFHGGVV